MKSDEVRALISVIGPLLHGHDPAVVSAVLADLTAMLLAGFQGEDREQARDALFKQHVELVMNLVPINEETLLMRIRTGA